MVLVLLTEAGNSLSLCPSHCALFISVCRYVRVCCMKKQCRPLCHYKRLFAHLLAKHACARTQTHTHITHPQTTRAHTPSRATRVALCGSHTPWCAEQSRKMAHHRMINTSLHESLKRSDPACNPYPVSFWPSPGYRSYV